MNSVFQNGGVYVVIGGAGGVGEVFSEYLIRTYQAHVIWLGRRVRNGDIDAKVARMAAFGPAPEYIQADAANLESLQSAYHAIKARHARINGLVHSAIVLQDQSLAQMSEERMQSSLAAKLDVSVRMAQVFAREAPDFVLFFSSFQSFAKAPGQSNYAAGCTFKDAFAQQLRNAWSCPVKVVNWGYWGSVGIVASEAMRERMAKIGLASIEGPEAMQAIESLLAGPRDQVILMKTRTPDAFLPGPPRAGTLTWLPEDAASVALPAQAIRAAADSVALPMLPVQQEDADALVNAAIAVMLCQLQSIGLFREARDSIVKSPQGLSQRYEKWLEESTRVLLERGLLRRTGSSIAAREVLDPNPAWSSWEAAKAQVIGVTGRESDLALVDTTLRELPAILAGRKLATDVLFPNASLSQVTGVYHENPQTTFYNEVLARALIVILRRRLEAQPGYRLRLFEVGAGTGGTSAVLFKHLAPYAASIETYVYTDISKAFLLHAESAFRADAPYLKTQLFNVERPLADQELRPGDFDVVIAANVLHATRNMHRTVHNCKALLRRGGVMLLNEMAMNTIFSHLTFGLLDGWWLYEDPALRITGSPGLTPSTWARLLDETGFPTVLFPCERAHERGQAVIVAQSDGLVRPLLQVSSVSGANAKPAVKRSGAGERRLSSATVSAARMDSMTEGSLARVTASHASQPVASSPDTQPHTQMAREHVAQVIMEHISVLLKVPLKSIEFDEPFADYGVDSITGVQIVHSVNRDLGIELETTSLFQHPTIEKLADHIVTTFSTASSPRAGLRTLRIVKSDAPTTTQPPRSVQAPLEAGVAPMTAAAAASARAPIAIVGLSGRFSGSDSLEEFWQHLANGDDLVTEVSRWNLAAYDSGFATGQKGYCRHGSFLTDIDRFDASFFNISGVEAKFMDPQQRLFLEEAWKALENAGYAGAGMEGARCGVYVGVGPGDYSQLLRSAGPPQAFWGNATSVLASRIAYYLDLKGPAVSIDTACSSSLVALHLAVQSLWLGETDVALAGGVFVQSSPNFYLLAGRSGMLSASGRCHTFDAQADGFVPAEGVGVVVLRRLADALADGDHIHGVIRGSGINQDGATNGITAPSAQSQEQLERAIYETFSIDPGRIQMVEAHGTGTELGDPIEFQALTRAFRGYTQASGYCAIGSVKSNIGHAAPAAGMAGLFKLLLALRHRQIPPSIHFETCNPAIQLDSSPFYVNTSLRDWPAAADGPRMAALSSFGFSGTNAHVVIEEAPPQQRQPAPRSAYLVVLSARNEAQLQEQAARLIQFCETQPQVDVGNLSFTLLLGRRLLEHRLAAIVTNPQDLVARLSKWSRIGQSAQVCVGHAGETGRQQQAALKRYGNQCLLECGQDVTGTGYVERLAVVAELFVQGYQLDFRVLFQNDAFARVPLPVYPLDRKRHWVDEQPAPAPVAAAPLGTGHPLLHRNTSTFHETTFDSRFTGEEFFLRDHQIQGRRILPGVAHLEIVRAAVAAAAPETASVQLRNFHWLRPAEVLDGSLSLTVRLRPQSDTDLDFDIVSGDGSNLVFSQGKVRLSGAHVAAPQIALQALLSKCQARTLSNETIYRTFSELGFAYGPAHQAIKALHVGQDAQRKREVVAELELPSVPDAAAAAFHLHPSLLDGALQACMGLNVPLENDSASSMNRRAEVPFAIERVDIYDKCPARAWVWVRDSAGSGQNLSVRKLDVSLCDETGRVCVEFGGFAWRALAPQARSQERARRTNSSALLLAPSWEISQSGADQTGPDQTRGVSVADGNHWVLLVGSFPQWTYTELQRNFIEAHCERITVESTDRRPVYEVTATRTFEIGQRILRSKPKSATLQVVIAANTEAKWGLSGLAALLRTASLENPHLITQCIELQSALSGAELSELLRRDARAPVDREIRYRDGRREVRSLRLLETLDAEHAASEAGSVPWRDHGVYLITGGLGGLGLIVARSIAARAQHATLILVGRSEPSSQQSATLAELRALGASADYRRLDVANASSVRELIEHVTREHGGLTGVLHSAGVLRDSYIINKSLSDMQEVLAPKVAGVINLDEATRDLELDVFVLFSSVVSLVGNPGQADYAAANGFMDAYSHYRNRLVAQGQRRGRTLCINWPLWEKGGMQVDSSIVAQLQAKGMVPLTTQHGVAVLNRCIQAVEFDSQVAVFVRDAQEAGKALAPEPPKPAQTAPVSVRSTVAGARELLDRVQALLLDMVRELLQIPADEVDLHKQISEYGFDSLNLTELTNRLQARCTVSLVPTIFFEHSTLGSFAAYLAGEHSDAMAAALKVDRKDTSTNRAAPSGVEAVPDPVARLTRTPEPIRRLRAVTRVPEDRAELAFEPIAVIGMSGSFPHAPDIEELWQVLKEGKDCITEIPPDRWDWRALYGEPGEKGFKTNVKWGGFVDSVKVFDPLFFGIQPREAEFMDPQRRVLLTHAWKAIEDAGYAPASLSGSRTAVFVGTGDIGWGNLAMSSGATEGFATTGLSAAIGPNRVSFHLNLHGPSEPIDTACSSSLVAIHRAVNTLRAGQCDLAITGGVNIIVTPMGHVGFSRMGMLSPEGRCKTFSADANGYVRSEGVGLLLLKRLSEAEAAGDHIYGVILHTGENHGGRATSPTAPNAKAQAELVRSVYAEARIDPRTITYVEAHGTGTRLGDPVEINGLKSAFNSLYAATADSPLPTAPCGLGSVKSNIGHLELASGVAAIAKVLLQMKHRTLVRSLHCEIVNPLIDLADSPFYILDRQRPWEALRDERGNVIPRRAGISSFGVGGVNAHVVLEEYCGVDEELGDDREIGKQRVIVLSARTEQQLQQQARNLLAAVQQRGFGDQHLARIAYTLQVGRDAMRERLGVLASDIQTLSAGLHSFLQGKSLPAGVYRGQAKARKGELSLFNENEELQEAIGKWVERGRYDSLLELWVQGLEFDWRRLYAANPPRRISLPTYPFAQESFWISKPAEPAKASAEPVDTLGERAPRLHPLVHQNSSTLHETRFSSVFSGEEFFLRDHVVQGRKVLPGVAHLEMARAALNRAVGQEGSYELRDIMWLRPITAEGARTSVDVVLRSSSEQAIQLEILAGSTHQVCSRAKAEKIAPKPASPVDLRGLLQLCNHSPLTAADIYHSFEAAGLGYGPNFRTIQKLQVGNIDGMPQALARLKLPASAQAAQDENLIHPGLLDGALQASLGLSLAEVGRSQKLSLPFALQAFRTHGKCPPEVWAWLRYGAGSGPQSSLRRLDITLLDDAGRVCVEFLGLNFREIPAPEVAASPAAVQAAQTIRLTPRWRASELGSNVQPQAATSAMDRCVLLVEGFSESDAQELRGHLTSVVSGARIDCLLLRTNRIGLAEQYRNYAVETLNIVRGLLQSESGRPILIQLVIGAPAADTAHCIAGLSVLLKTASAENPRLLSQCIATDGALSGEALAKLLQSNATQLADQEIRYRNGTREVREIVELSAPEKTSVANRPWREDGVYLITGGLGGLGYVFAREILTSARHARVMLCGRSALDAAKQQSLQTLQQHGIVEYWQVDVADRGVVATLIESIQRKHGGLTGVIHSAGVILDKYIVNKSEADAEHVLAPKVAGIVNLDEATATSPLDFFVAFSSVAGVFGNPGQADYAAANAFIDRYIERRQGLAMTGNRAGKSLSVNWPLWAEGGMNVTEAMQTLFKRHYGIVPLPTNVGVQELYRCLLADEPQVIVIHGEANRLTQSKTDVGARSAESAQPAEHVTEVMRQALAKWLKVTAADIDTGSNLADLGFDSVSLTEFTLWLNSEYELSLSPAIFIEHPGLPSFCEYLAAQHADKFLPASRARAPEPAALSTHGSLRSELALRTDAARPVGSTGTGGELPAVEHVEHVTEVMRQALAKWLKVTAADIDTGSNLADLGFDSVSLTEFSLWLNSEYELSLSPAIFIEHPGLPSFCEYLATQHAEKFLPASQARAPALSATPRAAPAAPSEDTATMEASPKRALTPALGMPGTESPGDDRAINEVQRSYAEMFLENSRRAFASAEPVKHLLLQTSQGFNVEVITAGRGPTLLLLPPLAILANAWMHQFVEFSKSNRVVTLNYPGCGRSEYASRFASLESIAQQAFECLDALACEECDIVGWSMGSYVAQLMATLQPRRVRTLTLVSTPTRLSQGMLVSEAAGMFQDTYVDFAAHIPTETAENGARAVRFEFFKASYTHSVLARYAQTLMSFDYRSQFERLGEIKTLIISGGNDPWNAVEDSRLMQQRMRCAEHFEVEQAGHCIPLQHREWFNRKLADFLESASAALMDPDLLCVLSRRKISDRRNFARTTTCAMPMSRAPCTRALPRRAWSCAWVMLGC